MERRDPVDQGVQAVQILAAHFGQQVEGARDRVQRIHLRAGLQLLDDLPPQLGAQLDHHMGPDLRHQPLAQLHPIAADHPRRLQHRQPVTQRRARQADDPGQRRDRHTRVHFQCRDQRPVHRIQFGLRHRIRPFLTRISRFGY